MLDSESNDAYAGVDLLASDFLARYRDGDHPTVEEYARRHPEFGNEIRRMFPLVASIERVKTDQQTASDGSATLAGRSVARLGDYRIVREIGRGGMGIVFEAEQESLGRRVAIKVLPKQSLLDSQSLQRFHREAQTAAAMHHSNIVPIFGTGEFDGSHYLVMQLVRGQALDQKLSQNDSPFPFREIARIGEQIADAIAYAHDNGVLHRDIKPANILIEDDGTAQVTDFGLARNLADDPTATRTLSGSLRYMAPERFRGVSDPRSDVYSLGLTLYEMLARRPAFEETDPEQLIGAIANAPPKSIKSIRPDIPIDLETIVLKAIHPEPALRYPDAASLRDDLQRFLSDEPIQARRISPAGRLVRWCRRNPKLATANGIAAAALVMATVVSSAAFLITSAANRQSLEALNTSEQTVNLALQSLDGVVEVVSVSPSVVGVEMDDAVAFDGKAWLPDVSLSPSPHSARILERIQPLYERLSQQAPTRPDIVLQMIDASIQLARIQHQLGRTSTAIVTLQSSIDLLHARGDEAQVPISDKQLRLARLNNELGVFHSAALEFARADQSHEAAIAAASTLTSANIAGQVELARAHLLLGDLPPPRRRAGMPDDQRAVLNGHIIAAMEILMQLRESGASGKTVNMLHARSLLTKSRLGTTPLTKTRDFNDAVAMLREQLAETPDDASVRFELVQTLADINLRRELSPRQLTGTVDRLQTALDELRPLRAGNPDTPAFSIAEVHLRHKLAAIARNEERFSEADVHLQEAITIQTSLVKAWPDSILHRCWRALLYRSQAEVNRARNDEQSAVEAIENAIEDLDTIGPDSANHPFVIRARQIITDLSNSTSR